MGLEMNANRIANANGSFEPQRTNNAILTIDQIQDSDILQLALNTFPIPKQSNEIVEIGYMNETRKVAGKAIYEDLTVLYQDYVDKQIASILWNWRYQVYNPITGKIGLAKDYKKSGKVKLVDPSGDNPRDYKIVGMWISNMNPGEIDHTASDTVKIECTITIDKAYPLFDSNIIEKGIKTL